MPHTRQQVGRGRTPGGSPPSLSAVSSQGWGGLRRPSPSLSSSLPSYPSPVPRQSLGQLEGKVATAAFIGAGAAKGAAVAGPIGAAVGAAVAATISLVRHIKTRNRQKTASTTVVNDVEPMLKQNLDAYLGSNRTQSEQAASVENFYMLWNVVVESCSDPLLGSAGERCISEREEGASPPWGPNWFQLYLDPIRNDPNVIQDPGVMTDPATGKLVGGGGGDGIFGGFNLGPEMIPGVSNVVLLGGAAVALLLIMGTGGDGK